MPSAVIDATSISHSYEDRTVLRDVALRVDGDSRIALIGANGSGKSTLLRIAARLEQPDAGTVEHHGTVGLLPQLVAAPGETRTVRKVLLDRIGVGSASADVDRLERRLGDGDLDAVDPHAKALERWVSLGGPDADARVAAAADRLGVGQLLDRPLTSLSGGQAARAGLAALESARFDVALLDEPTNHLDADGLGLLRELLSRRHGYVVVSHDRALLRDVASEVVELSRRTGEATVYGGGFDSYERERKTAREQAAAAYDEATAKKAALEAAVRETRDRAAASIKKAGRQTHDGDKHSREWVKMRAEGMQRRARVVEGRGERVDVPEKPWQDAPLRLELSAGERRSAWVVALEGMTLRRGSFELGPIDLELGHGDRLFVSGPNGSGKSTLLLAIEGALEPASGVRRVAKCAVIARLGQDRDALASDRPLAEVTAEAAGIDQTEARTALAWFGLGADAVARSAATLSPGERTRAELAVLAKRRVTCLLLDEPTNHLDLESLEALEAALRDWPGALVVATHDRELQESLGLTRELAL